MAISPTNASPLAPLQGGDRSRVASQFGRDIARGLDTELQQRRLAGDGEDGQAELLDDDRFQAIVDQATDRARQINPNAARGSFVDILV